MATSNSFSIPQTASEQETDSTSDAMDNGEEKADTNTLQELPFFNEDTFTDVVLLVGGQQLYTNRSLLAYASPVFSCMFTAQFREKNEKVTTATSDVSNSFIRFRSSIFPTVLYAIMLRGSCKRLCHLDRNSKMQRFIKIVSVVALESNWHVASLFYEICVLFKHKGISELHVYITSKVCNSSSACYYLFLN